MPPERLQKVMANSGVASRRACEDLITEGHVTVNGEIVRHLGTKVDLARDVVEVDGRRIKSKQEKRYTYIMLYKPPGILSVFNDERGRPGLETLITSNNRLYPIGRLDTDSEGLLLLTDDGEMTLRLSHPRYEHVKTYYVLLNRAPGTDTLARVRRGIELGDGKTAPSDWKVIDKPPSVQPLPDVEQPDGAWIRVIMREGKKRQIRRMAAEEHLNVRRLIRVQIGPLMLDRKLKPGQSRTLNRSEIQRLRMATRPRTAGPNARRRAAGGARDDQRTGKRAEPSKGRTGSGGKGAATSKDRAPSKRGPTRAPAPNTKGGPPRSRSSGGGSSPSSKPPARQKPKGSRD